MVEKLKSNPSNTEGEPSLEESKPSNEWWRAPSFIGICPMVRSGLGPLRYLLPGKTGAQRIRGLETVNSPF